MLNNVLAGWPNKSISSAFYEARDNVYATYRQADDQFSGNVWKSPRLLFSYFKRPLGADTQGKEEITKYHPYKSLLGIVPVIKGT